MLGSGAVNSGAQYAFPGGVQSKNRIVFEVKDKAGNVSTKQLEFYNNSSCVKLDQPLLPLKIPLIKVHTSGRVSFKGSGRLMEVPPSIKIL